MNFLFVCGGTAGHVNPALAVAAELRRRVPDAGFLFIGAGRELENRLVPRAGFDLVNIDMSGLKRGFSPDMLIFNLKALRSLMAANVQARKIIRGFGPSAVIGTGGYICYPVLRTAARMGIPSLIHESNAVPGLTTKLLSACADKVLVSFPGLEAAYRKPERVVFTGTPVRGGFAAASEGVRRPAENSKPLVVSFWGSLGAERMNDVIAEFMEINIGQKAFDHIHAAGGSAGVDKIMKRIRQLDGSDELPPGMEIRGYIDDMPAVMSEADIVLCRAGGSTIAELAAMGKPAVLVPSPYVTNGQQIENARQVEKTGGALMINEEGCSGQVLFDAVLSVLQDRDRLIRMAEAQKALGVIDAASVIAGIILARCAEEK